MFWKQLWRIFQLAYAVRNVLRSLLFNHITKWESVLKTIMNNISVGLAVPNVLRSLLLRPHHEVGKGFGNNYEGYFSWLMQSLMFCEAYCSDHITKWENVLEAIMKEISWLIQSRMFSEAHCSDHITKWENVLKTIMNNISVCLCSP